MGPGGQPRDIVDGDADEEEDEDEQYNRMCQDKVLDPPRALPAGYLSPRTVSQFMKSAHVALSQGRPLDDPEVSTILERLCICPEIEIEDCKDINKDWEENAKTIIQDMASCPESIKRKYWSQGMQFLDWLTRKLEADAPEASPHPAADLPYRKCEKTDELGN